MIGGFVSVGCYVLLVLVCLTSLLLCRLVLAVVCLCCVVVVLFCAYVLCVGGVLVAVCLDVL